MGAARVYEARGDQLVAVLADGSELVVGTFAGVGAASAEALARRLNWAAGCAPTWQVAGRG